MRRLSEAIAEKRDAGELDKGGRPRKNRGAENPSLPTLAGHGVDKNLPKAARALRKQDFGHAVSSGARGS
jgi:hypothetical protein